MNDIIETGGARIGMAHATWPFAKLSVSKNVLQLNASIIGNLYFRPSDIISIEPSSFLAGAGIKVIHRVEKYSSNVIFLTSDASNLISRIESTGFLQNTDALPEDVEAEIIKYQSGGSFPIKWPAAIAFFVIWNLLFFADQLGYFGKTSRIPVGNGARLAIALGFIFALMLLISAPFRKLVLKDGRKVNDVKPFLLFLMLITGILFLVFSVIPN